MTCSIGREPWWTAEAFVQGQANKILNVRFRGLAGAGLRFRAMKADRFRLYAALLAMFEHEEIGSGSIVHRDLRWSSYASWNWTTTGILRIVNTTYWQPLVRDIEDYRIASQTDFVMRLSPSFSYVLAFHYAFDSRPPDGVVNSEYSIRNVLSVDFEK